MADSYPLTPEQEIANLRETIHRIGEEVREHSRAIERLNRTQNSQQTVVQTTLTVLRHQQKWYNNIEASLASNKTEFNARLNSLEKELKETHADLAHELREQLEKLEVGLDTLTAALHSHEVIAARQEGSFSRSAMAAWGMTILAVLSGLYAVFKANIEAYIKQLFG